MDLGLIITVLVLAVTLGFFSKQALAASEEQVSTEETEPASEGSSKPDSHHTHAM